MDEIKSRSRCYILVAPQINSWRERSACEQMDAVGLDYTLVRGFSPEDPMVAESYSVLRNALLMKRSLSKGEVATYLGHQKIWKKILEGATPWGIVLEDDFLIVQADRFIKDLSELEEYTEDFHIIKFFNFQHREPIFSKNLENSKICIHSRPTSGLVGYIITKAGCEKLLQQKYVYRPVDEELRYWFHHKIKVASVLPNLVQDNSDHLNGSLLEDDRNAVRKNRNVYRSIYSNLITAYVNTRSHLWSRHVADEFRKKSADD